MPDSTTHPLGGAVVSENHIASEIGTRILAAGGNAADAIIATTIAVNTTSPYHSDLGGAGFALIRTKEGEFESLNFRGCAPASATPEYYQTHSTTYGGSAVAIPSQMRGLQQLHDRHGRLPWAKLFEECIALARDGLAMGADMRHYITGEIKGTTRRGTYMEDKMYSPFFDDEGEVLQVGVKYRRVEYAKALERIAEKGVDDFYQGELGAGIIRAVKEHGGLMTMDDINNYTAEWNVALSAEYKGYKLWTIPAPASGSIWLNVMGILAEFDAEDPGSVTDVHRLTEALRLAYGTRTQLGDPDFVDGLEAVQKHWISKEYAKERAAMIDDEKTQAPEYYKPPLADIKVDNGTSNITVADSDGLVISITTTVGLPFGSRIITEHGIVLNDSMDDFSVQGRPNNFGYEPSVANYVAGKKRPLSSSCPFIITDKDGNVVLAGGAAGGSTIISANAQLARNVLDYGMSAAEAQRSGRIHNQVMPNVTKLERSSTHRGITVDGFTEEQAREIEAKGHKVQWEDVSMSTTCGIKFTYEDGEVDWEAAAEPRKHDAGGSVWKP